MLELPLVAVLASSVNGGRLLSIFSSRTAPVFEIELLGSFGRKKCPQPGDISSRGVRLTFQTEICNFFYRLPIPLNRIEEQHKNLVMRYRFAGGKLSLIIKNIAPS
jgi:hypothetical protein